MVTILTHYIPLLLLFYIPENIRKPLVFLTFSGGIKKQHPAVIGLQNLIFLFKIRFELVNMTFVLSFNAGLVKKKNLGLEIYVKV